MFIASLYAIARTYNQSQFPLTDQWIKNMWYTHTHTHTHTHIHTCNRGFPGGSTGKESTCIVGDLDSIPGWEDPLEKVMAAHSSIMAWRIPWTGTVHGVAKSWTWLSDFYFHTHNRILLSHKKEWNNAIFSNMDGSRDHHKKWSMSYAMLCYAMLSHFSHIRLCVTPQIAAHQASPSLGFSRQEHWSGLPFPSPMHESEKWKWSCSFVSDS